MLYYIYGFSSVDGLNLSLFRQLLYINRNISKLFMLQIYTYMYVHIYDIMVSYMNIYDVIMWSFNIIKISWNNLSFMDWTSS